MDEEEAKRAYDGISEVLRAVGMGWVAEQVEESVELGKTVTKKADASEFIDDKVAGQRRGRQRMQDFVTTEPFSNLERLNLLLDAINRVMALPDFEADALKILEAKDVTFVSEQGNDASRSLHRNRTEEQELARRRLREVLQQVRGVAA